MSNTNGSNAFRWIATGLLTAVFLLVGSAFGLHVRSEERKDGEQDGQIRENTRKSQENREDIIEMKGKLENIDENVKSIADYFQIQPKEHDGRSGG